MLVPGAGDPHCFGKRDLWFIAQFAPCFLDGNMVVRTVELDAVPREKWLDAVIADRGDALGGVGGGVESGVRHVQVWRCDADLAGNSREILGLS